jgi:phi LC3 family holin
MKINWQVRFGNKYFWITFLPTLLLLVQSVASLFGFQLDIGELSDKLIVIVDVLFVLLSLLGVVTDPTTKGVSDSDKAMSYIKPKQ